MKKIFLSFFAAVIAVGLAAMPTFAGTSAVNNGAVATGYFASLEAVGADTAFTITPPAGSDGVTYTPASSSVASGDRIRTLFTGIEFQAGVYSICNAGATIATGTPGVGSTDFFFDATAASAANAPLNITGPGVICAAADQPSSFQINGTTSTGSGTVQFLLSSGGLTVDSAPALTVTTVRREYTVAVANANIFIDFIGTPGTGTLVNDPLGGPDNRADSGPAGPNIGITVIANTTSDAALTTTATVSLIDSESWAGVTRAYLAASATPCDSSGAVGSAGNLVGQSSPSGTIALLVPAGTFSATTGVGTLGLKACVDVNSTTLLETRTIGAFVDLSVVGAGANDPAATPTVTAQTWALNGAVLSVAGLKDNTSPVVTTNITITNVGTKDGKVVSLSAYTDTGVTRTTPVCVLNPPSPAITFLRNGTTVISANDIVTQCASQHDLAGKAFALSMILDIAPGDVIGKVTKINAAGSTVDNPLQKGSGGAVYRTE